MDIKQFQYNARQPFYFMLVIKKVVFFFKKVKLQVYLGCQTSTHTHTKILCDIWKQVLVYGKVELLPEHRGSK